MTNEQIKARLNAIRKTAESLHGGGYSYDSGAPSEACWDVRWLLAHIDGLNLALSDAKVRLRVLGDSLGIERWLGQHKYRTVMHRHDGCWRAVDEASQLRLDADTFEELAEMLATLADGHKLTMAKPPNRDQINDFLDRESKNKDWIIEYEIPPLRAIYTAEASSFTEAELREDIKVQQPRWKIRNIKLKSS